MSDKTTEQRLLEALDRIEAQEAEAKKAMELAAQAEANAKFATKEDLADALKSIVETLAEKIGEEVAKAMPVERPEGAGRVGEEKTEEETLESSPVEYLAKKALTDYTPDDKRVFWELTKRQLTF